MFDIGFWEIALIGAVALLVVGPERLPGMARTIGFWVGRIRHYVQHVKDDIEREIQVGQIKEFIDKPNEELGGLYSAVEETKKSFNEAKSAVNSVGADFESSLNEVEETANETVTNTVVSDAQTEPPLTEPAALNTEIGTVTDPDPDPGAASRADEPNDVKQSNSVNSVDVDSAPAEDEPRVGQR